MPGLMPRSDRVGQRNLSRGALPPGRVEAARLEAAEAAEQIPQQAVETVADPLVVIGPGGAVVIVHGSAPFVSVPARCAAAVRRANKALDADHKLDL